MSNISEKAKRERAAYMREYRKRNPDKTREINARYWEKRAAAKKTSKEEQQQAT